MQFLPLAYNNDQPFRAMSIFQRHNGGGSVLLAPSTTRFNLKSFERVSISHSVKLGSSVIDGVSPFNSKAFQLPPIYETMETTLLKG